MEKKVSFKLLKSEIAVLLKYCNLIVNIKPENLDMNGKLLVSMVRQIRRRVMTKMINERPDYAITFPEHEALALLLAIINVPSATQYVDSITINKIKSIIHQKMV